MPCMVSVTEYNIHSQDMCISNSRIWLFADTSYDFCECNVHQQTLRHLRKISRQRRVYFRYLV